MSLHAIPIQTVTAVRVPPRQAPSAQRREANGSSRRFRIDAPERISINDNRAAAGALNQGVLTIRLEVSQQRVSELVPTNNFI